MIDRSSRAWWSGVPGGCLVDGHAQAAYPGPPGAQELAEPVAFVRHRTTNGVPLNGYYLPYLLDPDHADRLWDLSEKLTA